MSRAQSFRALSTFGLVSLIALGACMPAVAAPAKAAKAAVAVALTSDEQAVVLRDAALKSNAAYEFVSELTTRFGARPAGSASEKNAAEWSAQKLKAMGFSNVRIETFPLALWQRGTESLEVTGPYPQKLVATALGGSAATPPEGVEGEAVIFDTYQEFTDSKADLKGKIVVILQPTVRTQTGIGYGLNSGSVRRKGPLEAKARGAVGYVMRSLGTEDQRFAHTGGTRFQEAGNGIASMAISPPDAENLERMRVLQAQGKAAPIRIKMISTPSFPGTGQSQNVIAEIPGRETPDQIIAIGGHLDSWDLGTGAIDDGAGVAITMAAAKLMIDHNLKPKRTIRVIFYGSEEVSQPGDLGLSGARAYAEHHAAEMAKHVVTTESDFGADVVYAAALPATDDKDFNIRLGKVLYPLSIYIDPAVATSGGPDTGPTVAKGVPVFDLQQEGKDYFDTHHTADDVLDRIDPKKMSQNVAAWAATLWMIADTGVTFKPVATK